MTLIERELLLTLAWVVKSQMQMNAIGAPFHCGNADSNVRLLDGKIEAVLVAGLTAPAPLSPRPKYVSIETAKEHCRNVAVRWLGRSSDQGKVWAREGDGAIHAALLALGPNPDPDAVAAAGAPGYAYLYCDGCADDKVTLLVKFGEYEPHGLCQTCIREGMALLNVAIDR